MPLNRQIKIRQISFCVYVRMAIPYQTAKFNFPSKFPAINKHLEYARYLAFLNQKHKYLIIYSNSETIVIHVRDTR